MATPNFSNDQIKGAVSNIINSGGTWQDVANTALQYGVSMDQIAGAYGTTASEISREAANAGVNTQSINQLNSLGQTQKQPPLSGLSSGVAAAASQGNPFQQYLSNLMSDPNAALQADPGYQFRLQQGTEAVNRSAGAAGQLQSGNRLQALTQYGQGLASQEYNNAVQQALAASQYGQGVQQQNYNQQLGLAELQAGLQGQQYNMLTGSAQLDLAAQQQQFNQTLAGAQYFTGLNQQQIQNLMALSGASTGSPAAAGQLYGQGAMNQWGMQQTGLGQLMYGIGQLNTQMPGALPGSANQMLY